MKRKNITAEKSLQRLMAVFLAFFLVPVAAARDDRPVFNFEGDTQGWAMLGGMEANAATGLFVDDSVASVGYHSLGVHVRMPGDAAVFSYISKHDTSAYESMAIDVYIPEDAPAGMSCYLFLQDGEWLWYETRAHQLSPGEWNTISASIAPGSMAWRAVGHPQPWGPLSRANLNSIGVKIISDEEYTGQFNIDNVIFRRVMFPEHKRNTSEPTVGEKFELSFNLPNTYNNPFDPEEVSVYGEFTGPSGKEIVMPGFFYQEYERFLTTNNAGRRLEALEPKGSPSWKIRYTPLEAGTHTYRIAVLDYRGVRSTERIEFDVSAGDPPGFVQLDPKGGPGFVLDCGSYFYPIGFNYRSPYDVRYEQNILGKRLTNPVEASSASNVALDDGTFGYEENMAEMAEYGMNFMETWMAPWWVAIEWSPQRIGFRGAGRYNLRTAWKLDRVMKAAAEHGIYIQLVLINHGQLSTFCDQEWQDHPYNIRNGGFLESPEQVFSDPVARKLTKNMLRYIVARWGYSPYIFAWDLLNEMNLVGDSSRFWQSKEIVEWFREMTLYLKEIDPYEHMVTGHFTGNFDSDIFRIEEVDFTANNAYYNVNNQDLVSRLRGTYNFHRRFEKPFMIAEFGGTSGGGTIRNLRRDLQVALWAGYTMPIAASPLFWWHQLVRDQDWYHKYTSLSQFEQIVGEKRRNMDTYLHWELIRPDEASDISAAGQVMHCTEENAYVGWFYNQQYVQNLSDELVLQDITDVKLRLPRLQEGTYRLVIWDTRGGKAIFDNDVTLSGESMTDLPAFNKDIALFFRLLN